LFEGANTVYVACQDDLLNADTVDSNKHLIYTVDTLPPETTITSKPSNPTNQTSANFEFTSTEPGSSFECILDAGVWTSCTSPKSYRRLSEGSHTFYVRATDMVGNTDPTPAQYSWEIVKLERLQVSAGVEHTCAVASNGTLWCWGANWSGQLGDGTNDDKNTPTQVGTGTDWESVAAGWYHTCGVKTGGTLWCWGANWFGQLGDGTAWKENPIEVTLP